MTNPNNKKSKWHPSLPQALTENELDQTLEIGYQEALAGKTRPAKEVFQELAYKILKPMGKISHRLIFWTVGAGRFDPPAKTAFPCNTMLFLYNVFIAQQRQP
ncbi:MAG: hypothetical protein ACI3X3_03310 [Acidaminococcus sp.]|uniref:hypothetical protein n=1 Tax=Acidaminococcus sp. TaxID=1872103 RepID=UPI003F164760